MNYDSRNSARPLDADDIELQVVPPSSSSVVGSASKRAPPPQPGGSTTNGASPATLSPGVLLPSFSPRSPLGGDDENSAAAVGGLSPQRGGQGGRGTASSSAGGSGAPVTPLSAFMKSTSETANDSEESDHAQEVQAFLNRVARVGGCFRVRYIFWFMVICLLGCNVAGLLEADRITVQYIEQSGQSVCSQTAAVVLNQIHLQRDALTLLGAKTLRYTAYIYGNQSRIEAPAHNRSIITSSLNNPCNSFLQSVVAFARYNALGNQTAYFICDGFAHILDEDPRQRLPTQVLPGNDTHNLGKLRYLEADQTLMYTTMVLSVLYYKENHTAYLEYDPLSAPYQQLVQGARLDPDSSLFYEHEETFKSMLLKVVFGTFLFSAVAPSLSTAALLSETNIALFGMPIDSKDTRGVTFPELFLEQQGDLPLYPLVHSLNSFYQSYAVEQPSRQSALLASQYVNRCQSGGRHTWHAALADDTQSAFPQPHVDDDEEFAVLCGVLCTSLKNDSSSCQDENSNLVVVVQTRASEPTFNLVRTLIKIIMIVDIIMNTVSLLALHVAIGFPLYVLHRHVLVALSGHPMDDGKQRIVDRCIRYTRWMWMEDMKSLMRTFNIMATFFYLNRKHVPEHVLHAQMERLTQSGQLKSYLSSSTAGAASSAEDLHQQAESAFERNLRQMDEQLALGGSEAGDIGLFLSGAQGGSSALQREQSFQPTAHSTSTTAQSEVFHPHDLEAGNVLPTSNGSRPPTPIITGPSGGDGIHHTTSTNDRKRVGEDRALDGMIAAESATILYVVLLGLETMYRDQVSAADHQHQLILAAIASIIRKYGGQCFQKSGDRLAAAWNAFHARADHALRATRCAIAIAKLFEPFRAAGFRMGLVVHQGPVVCGILGDATEASSVLFGVTPAQAERLGHLVSRVAAFNVVITEPVKVTVSIHFECVIVDLAKDNDVVVGLFDVRERNRDRSFTEFAMQYTTAFSNFRVHQFREAEQRLSSMVPDGNPLVQRLLTMCRHYQTNTPLASTLPNPVMRLFPEWVHYEEAAELHELALAAEGNGEESLETPGFATALAGHVAKRTQHTPTTKDGATPTAIIALAEPPPINGANVNSAAPPAVVQPAQSPAQSAVPQVLRATLIESVTWSLVNGKGATPPPPQHAALAQSMGGFQSVKNFGESLTQMPDAASGALPTDIEASNGVTYVRGERVLGTGSFGCVYLGMEKHSGRLVAMKFLPLPSDDNEVRLLQNEVDTMESVTDANLVEFYGYAFVDNMIVLMMECLVAGSLSGMLSTFSTLPEPTTINFMRDVLRGLHRLHSTGIVHRDVKPQNVLISTTGHCKISDFGASASIHELVRRHDGGAEVQGTPIYLAPEAARGHAEPKSDIWSVGIMYLQLTTGSIPYENITAATNVASVVFGIGTGRMTPTIPADLSPLARPFVEGCLATDVAKRMTAVELLSLPLFFC